METPSKRPKLKLVGEDGNAFFILGLAKRASQKAKWNNAQWLEFRTKAMSGNYDNLVATCCEYFEVS